MEHTLPGGQVVLIDEEDAHLLTEHNWRAYRYGKRQVYATCAVNRETQYLHRMITEAPKGSVVDHINGNGLDNRRCNLRVCTHRDNIINSVRDPSPDTGFFGVERRRSGMWGARVKTLGVTHRSSGFSSAVEAAKERDRMAIALLGEHAPLNFPQDTLE
jgi:hypothetical protein